MKLFKTLTACAALLVVGTSCEHKDLCYDHSTSTIGHVKVVFDWTYAPDANPETMSIYLFPKSGDSPQRFDFVGRDGGSIAIAAGEYNVVCINSDTYQIKLEQPNAALYSGEELYKYFTATTDETTLTYKLTSVTPLGAASAPRARGTEDERVAYAPDAIWTDSKSDFVVVATDDGTVQTITLYPQQAFCTYNVKLQNIENIENVYELSATISGMAGGVYVAQRIPTDDVVTVPFAVSLDVSDTSGTGTVNTFGHCPGDDSHQHFVTIYAVMNDGNAYSYIVDVTDQVHNATDAHNVSITIDGVPLPAAEGSTDQGNITVEDWETIVTEIIM